MTLSKTEQFIGTLISTFVILLFLVYLILGIIGTDNEAQMLATLVIAFIISSCTCFIIFYRLRKSNQLEEINYLNVGTQRYLLGLFMVFYGIPKLFGAFFDYQLSALDRKLVDVSEFELAWYYFGKNNWQELVSGILEFVPGLLLFNRRTYYIASLLLLFVTAQVFVLNFFFKIGGVTFPAATILLACNMYIIYSQKQYIVAFFKSLNFSPNIHFSKHSKLIIKVFKGLGIFLLILVIFIKVRPHVGKSKTQRQYELLVGKYALEKATKNNQLYIPTTDTTMYKDIYIEKQSRWNVLLDFRNDYQAFVLEINPASDSLDIYINKGEVGDGADIIDSASVLKGKYKLMDNQLLINGIQLNDTLELVYKKQDLEPKKWLW